MKPFLCRFNNISLFYFFLAKNKKSRLEFGFCPLAVSKGKGTDTIAYYRPEKSPAKSSIINNDMIERNLKLFALHFAFWV